MTATSDAPLDSPGFGSVLASASAEQTGPTGETTPGALAASLVIGGNLDLLALLDGQEISAEMQELLDAITAIVNSGIGASDEEAASLVTADVETLIAAAGSDTVEELVATLKIVIAAATDGARPLPTQPATTPAAPVIASVPADPRPFVINPDGEGPPAPPGLIAKGLAPATTDDGVPDELAAPAGKSKTAAQAAVPEFARQLGSRTDGKSHSAAASKPVTESLPSTARATSATAVPVPTGDTPAAVAQTVPTVLRAADGPIGAVVGFHIDGDGTAPVTAASDLKVEVVTPAPAPPAATVEIATGGSQVQSAAGAAARPPDEVQAIPVAAPMATVTGASDTALVTRTPVTAGQPDVAAQIVRHARLTIAEGGGKATLQLQPPELGRLDLEITVAKGGIVSMHVISHSQEARSLVQAHFAELQSSLQDQGLEVGELSVSVQDQREASEWQADGGPGGGSEGTAEIDSLDLGINPSDVPLLAFAGYGTLDFSA